jgi:hypothetical protein
MLWQLELLCIFLLLSLQNLPVLRILILGCMFDGLALVNILDLFYQESVFQM